MIRSCAASDMHHSSHMVKFQNILVKALPPFQPRHDCWHNGTKPCLAVWPETKPAAATFCSSTDLSHTICTKNNLHSQHCWERVPEIYARNMHLFGCPTFRPNINTTTHQMQEAESMPQQVLLYCCCCQSEQQLRQQHQQQKPPSPGPQAAHHCQCHLPQHQVHSTSYQTAQTRV